MKAARRQLSDRFGVEQIDVFRAAIDALAARIAVVDATGTIIAVNRPWNAFALERGGLASRCCIGVNYLEVCDQARGPDAEGAAAMSGGIRAVLDGRMLDFSIEYPCVLDAINFWYRARVTRCDTPSPMAVVAHEDITIHRKLERELAQVAARERQRIGRDLHDDICQRLTAISCMARVTEKRLAAQAAPQSAEVARIVDMVQQATHQTRDLARRLSVSDLTPTEVVQSLHDLALSVESVYGVKCQVHCENDAAPDLPPETVGHLFRIAQEAVTNAARHAQAQNLGIFWRQSDGGLSLDVFDDGKGFPKHASDTGAGLHIMRQRAALIHATFEIVPVIPHGTHVCCRLRLPSAE